MHNFSLKAILDTFTTDKGTKRMIFNQAPIGGKSSKTLILFFIALPFIEYAVIFNPYSFKALGIAQAIIFFIIFLVFIMQVVFVMIWMNNKKVKKRIAADWDRYFPGIDLHLVLSGGSSPYREFFNRYTALDKNVDEASLHESLKGLFTTMQEENAELIAAMNKGQ